MAIIDSHDQFVITPKADQLLSGFSRNLSDAVLKLASQKAAVGDHGMKVVRTDDIKSALTNLCMALEEGIKARQLDPGISEYVQFLRAICDSIGCEPTSGS